MSNSQPSNTIPLNELTPQAANPPWCDYPAGIGGHNAITTPGKSLSYRLTGLSEILFSDEIDLRIVDIRSDNGKHSFFADKKRALADDQSVGATTCTQKVYKKATKAESVLLQEDKDLPRIRIM